MKKFMSLATLICILAMSFGISVLAENVELVYSSIENGAVNVGIDEDLELEFSETVDVDKMDLANIIVNGSRDMVKDSSLNDGKVDGFTYDEVAETLVIDFKTFSYGTRYTVEFVDIPFVDSADTYSGKLVFTTGVPSTTPQVLETIDLSAGLNIYWHTEWANSNTFDEEEKANRVGGGANSLCGTTFKNYNAANAIMIKAKGVANSGYGGMSVQLLKPDISMSTSSNYDASILFNTTLGFQSGEYDTYIVPITHGDADPDEVRFWTAPANGAGQVLIKEVSLIKTKDVVFTNKKLLEVDATKQKVFSGWNIWNAGNSTYNESEQANQLEGSWAVLDSTIPSYKNADKILITLKRTDGKAGNVTVITTSTDCKQCDGIDNNTYSRTNNITVNEGPEYTTIEVPIEHKTGENDSAYLWITADHLVKRVEVIPKNYMPGDYYTGEFNVIKNYGKASEEVKTKAGLEEGSYTAVLNGVNNMSGEKRKITLVNALYDNKKLVDIKIAQTKTLENGESVSEPITAELKNVPDYKDGMELKAMVFDNDLKPVKDCISVKDDKRVKVLIVGNSITYHRPANLSGVLWDGAWGMAASSEANDYAHRLIASAESEGYNTEFMIGNTLGFEDGSVTEPRELPKYKEFAPDIIIVALGANVNTNYTSTFLTLYENFIKEVGAQKVITVSTMWGPEEFWSGIETMSETNDGWAFVDCRKKSTPTAAGGGTSADFGNWSAMNTLGDNGVGWHPGNTGMKLYAEQIWNEQLKDTIATVAAEK